MPKTFVRRFTKKIIIVTNIVVALMFLLGCYGGNFNAKTWWPIGFLTLASFYFLLLLILFLLFWLFVKAKLSLISIIALVLAINPIRQIIPLRLSSSFKKEKTNNALRIMSWNVEHFNILEHKTHPEIKQQMLDVINNYSPDIAFFQEMVGGLEHTNAINYVPTLQTQLNFSNYNYSYNTKLDFDDKHHFGIITFSKYPIIKKEKVEFFPYDYNSIFQYTDIVKGGDTVRVFNIHLESLKFSADNLRYIDEPGLGDKTDLKKSRSILGKLKRGFFKRQIQSDRIKAVIAQSPYPVIVCGDFNDVPNSYSYTTIGDGLKNAFAEKGSGLGRTFSGISPALRIDNIFVASKFNVLQYDCISKKLSDHFPVVADVEIKK
jgi:endonuclease/exonuclease/phosphatase family metal-dependent hydrolase